MRFMGEVSSSNSSAALRTILNRTGEKVEKADAIYLLQNISQIAAVAQLIFLLMIMLVGPPGIYREDFGFMYISDNFCTKQVLAAFFILSTLPSWVILACSVSMEKDPVRRTKLLCLISTPFPIGIGIVFFSLCTSPSLHYIYVNLFVGSIAMVHIAVARTAGHVEFIQTYSALLLVTSISGVIFLVLALVEKGPGIIRNIAVITEYIAVIGFILSNGLSIDRVREHVE
jgi:succinate dehydrogenase hydrophobic anchor subunit